MSLKAKRELLAALKDTYKNTTQEGKKQLLDAFQTATGYSRKHAITLLNRADKPVERKRGTRSTIYGPALKDALSAIWQAAGCICMKRLIPFLPELIPALERCNYIRLNAQTKASLLKISAATADRLLKTERQRLGRSVSTTKRGSLLRRQIAVKTAVQWDEVTPGFFEADLVAHNGGNPNGQFIHTLTLTDIATGWTECVPLIRKGDTEVIEALRYIQRRLPMPLLGLDTDNGSEFINHKLSDFCKQANIAFTRSRVFKSNDQCHVEEKNGSVVRKLVGYQRFEGERLHRCMLALYNLTGLYVNYFQPSSKLRSKVRDGGHVTKRYDKARTPCQRLLELTADEKAKQTLLRTFTSINLIELRAGIGAMQAELEENTKAMLRIPTAAAVTECKEQIKKRNLEIKRAEKVPKTGRPSIVSDEVTRVISFLMHQNPSMTATTLLPLLDKRYPGRFGNKQWATLARQIRKWRAKHPEYARFYPPSQRFYSEEEVTKDGLIFNESTAL